jgi:hypothetical protein
MWRIVAHRAPPPPATVFVGKALAQARSKRDLRISLAAARGAMPLTMSSGGWMSGLGHQPEQIWSAMPHSADLNKVRRYFAFGPEAEMVAPALRPLLG